MSEKDISTKHGDKIFCVFDSDVDESKQERILQAYRKAKRKGIELIMSVPSFELWYLLHYKKTTHRFSSNKELENELKKYINGYEKNKNVYPIIIDDMDKAITYSKGLKKHHQIDDESTILDMNLNPSTDVYKVIEYINGLLNE